MQKENTKKITELPGYNAHSEGNSRANTTYQEHKVVTNDEGVIEFTEHKSIKKTREGNFIKLYLEDLGYIHHLQGSQTEVLYHLLKRMSYDNLIVVNKAIKEIISKDTGKALSTINNAISKYHEKDILIKKGRGVYLANPYLFGKGKFEDINKIRMQLTYTADGVKLKTNIDKVD